MTGPQRLSQRLDSKAPSGISRRESTVPFRARAMRVATAAGALAVTKFGALDSMPLKADVEKLLLERGQ